MHHHHTALHPGSVSSNAIDMLVQLFPHRKRSVLELILRRCDLDLLRAIEQCNPMQHQYHHGAYSHGVKNPHATASSDSSQVTSTVVVTASNTVAGGSASVSGMESSSSSSENTPDRLEPIITSAFRPPAMLSTNQMTDAFNYSTQQVGVFCVCVGFLFVI